MIKSAAFSAIIMMGAFVLPEMMVGIIDPSTTRRPWIPFTLENKQNVDYKKLLKVSEFKLKVSLYRIERWEDPVCKIFISEENC